MLYCSDCDNEVEFKSLDVGGKLTHCCVECGSTNLFKNKEVYVAGVKLIEDNSKKAEEKKNKKAKEWRQSETKIILEAVLFGSAVLIILIILAFVFGILPL